MYILFIYMYIHTHMYVCVYVHIQIHVIDDMWAVVGLPFFDDETSYLKNEMSRKLWPGRSFGELHPGGLRGTCLRQRGWTCGDAEVWRCFGLFWMHDQPCIRCIRYSIKLRFEEIWRSLSAMEDWFALGSYRFIPSSLADLTSCIPEIHHCNSDIIRYWRIKPGICRHGFKTLNTGQNISA